MADITRLANWSGIQKAPGLIPSVTTDLTIEIRKHQTLLQCNDSRMKMGAGPTPKLRVYELYHTQRMSNIMLV